jgi:DNA-binding transcriptional regulator YiaG
MSRTINQLLQDAPDCADCGKGWCGSSCGRFSQLEEFQDEKEAQRHKKDAPGLAAYVQAFDEYEAERQNILLNGGALAIAQRHKTRLSLRKYAALMGVTGSYLSKVETGKEILSPELARKMLKEN